MAIVSQTRTESGFAEQSATSNADWSDVQRAIILNGQNTQVQLNTAVSSTSEDLRQGDWGFSFDPFATLQGVEITHSIIYSLTSGPLHTASPSFRVGPNLTIPGLSSVTGSQSFSGTFDPVTIGGPTNDFNINTSSNYAGIWDLETLVTNTNCRIFAGSGQVQYRHFGYGLTFYAEVPDNLVAALGDGGVRVGNERVRTTDLGGARYSHFVFVRDFSIKSDLRLVLGGQPFSMYEDVLGNTAVAVYDVEGNLDGPLDESASSYVYDGIRYSYLENSTHRVFRARTAGEVWSLNSPGSIIWKGVPVSLTADRDIVAKKVTGTIEETRRFSMGGVPLTAVRVGDDWAIAATDV